MNTDLKDNSLDKDDNLREAVCRREKNLPRMTDSLNARLMDRMEEEAGRNRVRTIWPWIAAASVAVLIAVLLAPPRTQADGLAGDTSLLAQTDEIQPEPVAEIQKDAIQTEQTVPDDYVVPEEPEAETSFAQEATVETPFAQEKTVERPEKEIKQHQKVEVEEVETVTDSVEISVTDPVIRLNTIPESLLAAISAQASETETEVLTEKDFPVTNPENLKHTEEEIAILQEKANEAYLKWWELELEIANYYLNKQTAQNLEQ